MLWIFEINQDIFQEHFLLKAALFHGPWCHTHFELFLLFVCDVYKHLFFYLLTCFWLETIKFNNPGLSLIQEDVAEQRVQLDHKLFSALTQWTSSKMTSMFPHCAGCFFKFYFNHNRCTRQKEQEYIWRSFLHQSWWIFTKPHLQTT